MDDTRHRVLLVREWDVQTSSSGCCGRLDDRAVGVLTEHTRAESPYARTREEMEVFGAVYRTLRERYREDELELAVVDPRNVVALAPMIWRDARKRGLSARQALRQVRRGTASRSLVCDGVAVHRGEVPDPQRAVAAVERDLAQRRHGGPG